MPCICPPPPSGAVEKSLSLMVLCVFCGLWKCSEDIIKEVCELGVFPPESP